MPLVGMKIFARCILKIVQEFGWKFECQCSKRQGWMVAGQWHSPSQQTGTVKTECQYVCTSLQSVVTARNIILFPHQPKISYFFNTAA